MSQKRTRNGTVLTSLTEKTMKKRKEKIANAETAVTASQSEDDLHEFFDLLDKSEDSIKPIGKELLNRIESLVNGLTVDMNSPLEDQNPSVDSPPKVKERK